MTYQQIKNLGVAILSVFVMGYMLILNYSLLGLIAAVVAIGAIFLVAIVYRKQESIVDKLDLYVLLVFLGAWAMRLDEVFASLSTDQFAYFDEEVAANIVALIVLLVLGLILSKVVANKRKSIAALVINKYLGFFLIMWGVSIFFLSEIDMTLTAHLVILYASFGLVAVCRFNRKLPGESPKENADAIKRLSRISFVVVSCLVFLKAFCPSLSVFPYDFMAFLNLKMLPWYSVLGLTLILAAIVGAGLHYGDNVIDEDAILLTGMIGLTWVAKAAVFFWFDFYWAAIAAYVLLFFAFANRYVKRTRSGKSTAVHLLMRDNELYWLLIAAVCTVVSIRLIHTGYIFLWLALMLCVPFVFFVKKGAALWVKDVVFWLSVLFSTAVVAAAISLQSGFSMQKLWLIAGLFVFTGIVMWMMNHKNNIGKNEYKGTKVSIAVVFALLLVISAFKAGTHVKLTYTVDKAHVGALVLVPTDLGIAVSADGKENQVAQIRYVWSDSFMHDEASILSVNAAETTLSIGGRHLILWTMDANGVETRSDYWFHVPTWVR